jgi:hypothetical protein
MKKFEFNDTIDIKILNHGERVYKQGDKAPVYNGPCKHIFIIDYS